MTNPAQETQVKVNVNDLTDIKCDQCKYQRFEPVFLLKRLPALLSPTGQDERIPIPTFACYSCGHINVGLLPRELRPQAPADPKIVASTLPELAVVSPDSPTKE